MNVKMCVQRCALPLLRAEMRMRALFPRTRSRRLSARRRRALGALGPTASAPLLLALSLARAQILRRVRAARTPAALEARPSDPFGSLCAPPSAAWRARGRALGAARERERERERAPLHADEDPRLASAQPPRSR